MNLHAVQHLLGSQSSILPLHRIEQMEVQICVYAFYGMRGLLLCPQKLYLASNGIKQGAPSSNQRSITIQIAKWTKQIIFRNTFSQCCFRGNDIASFVCFILTILNDKTGTAVQEQLSNMPILLFFLHMHKFITSIRILSPKQHHVTTQFMEGNKQALEKGKGRWPHLWIFSCWSGGLETRMHPPQGIYKTTMAESSYELCQELSRHGPSTMTDSLNSLVSLSSCRCPEVHVRTMDNGCTSQINVKMINWWQRRTKIACTYNWKRNKNWYELMKQKNLPFKCLSNPNA